jgi:hypothetical protein
MVVPRTLAERQHVLLIQLQHGEQVIGLDVVNLGVLGRTTDGALGEYSKVLAAGGGPLRGTRLGRLFAAGPENLVD